VNLQARIGRHACRRRDHPTDLAPRKYVLGDPYGQRRYRTPQLQIKLIDLNVGSAAIGGLDL
jgi:hypothetical protein